MGDLAAWLSAVHKTCVEILGHLEEEYGVDEVEGLLDLDPEDVDALVDRLKKSPGKKFRRALEALAIDAPPPGDAAGAGPKSIPEAVPPDKPCSSFLQGVAAAACRALLALVPELVGGAPPPRRPSSPGGPAAGAAAPAVAVLMPPGTSSLPSSASSRLA
jgi:hypothetical protein